MAEFQLTDETVAELRTKASQEELYDPAFSAGGSFGVRVSKTGRRAFFVVYPLHGKRKRMTLGNFPVISVAEARSEAVAIIRKAFRGEDAKAEWRTYRSSASLGEAAELFRTEYAPKECSPKTAQEYSRILEKEVLPLLGDRKIRDIRPDEIERLLHHIGKVRGLPVLAARVRSVISSLFTFSKSRGFVTKNPARETKPPHAKHPRDRILSLEELHKLFRALQDESAEIRSIFTLLVLTGQRVNKVLAMTWGDIRLDAWRVPSSSKRGPSCSVFLVPQAVQALREVRTHSDGGAFVFQSPRGGNRRSLARAVTRLNRKLKSEQSWNALDLYRTFQSALPRLGVRPDLVDLIQQRRATLRQRTLDSASYDYDGEVKEALLTWARAVLPPKPPGGSNKVIQLFK